MVCDDEVVLLHSVYL